MFYQNVNIVDVYLFIVYLLYLNYLGQVQDSM